MRILIADDESIIRMGLKAMLAELGHEVLTAMNGREAIQMARQHQPDLAILDIKMPYTDGLEAARAMVKHQPLPIILLTAFSDSDLVDRATDLPIQAYLVKPIEAAELNAAIAVASKRFREGLELTQKAQDIEESLQTRKLIDRAKGVLMARGLNEEEAYKAIQLHARNNGLTMREASLVILGKR